ncbi:MAG TPA: S8 family serine peptidase [Gaiellaceae bacterium]
MRTRTRMVAAALSTAAGLLALALPAAAAPPSTMHWYRWHPSAHTLEGRSAVSGVAAVLGVASMRQVLLLRSRYRFRVSALFPQLRAAEVVVTRALLANAIHDRRIRYLSPLGSHRRLTAVPADPFVSAIDPATQLPLEWQFAAAHVDEALEISAGSPSVVVGTIDSGAADVPDLAGKVDERWTVSRMGKLTRDRSASDLFGHGTAVASLIAANVNDGFGMAGFGGATHLIAVRAWAFTDVSTAAALMKLDSLGVRIVNMSFGGGAPETPIMLDAIHKAAADGMLLVAAAGNSARAVAHPAADLQPAGGGPSYGLAVGASEVHGKLAFFSNSGRHLSVLAPGIYDGACSGVLVALAPGSPAFDGSCYPTWGGAAGAAYTYVAGTSFSAPEVAGVAALIWAVQPQLTNSQVADIIKESAQRDSGWKPSAGCGVLDAGAALRLATSRTGDEWADAAAPTAACSAGE